MYKDVLTSLCHKSYRLVEAFSQCGQSKTMTPFLAHCVDFTCAARRDRGGW